MNDFNRFRHKETGEIVEAYQWWPGNPDFRTWGDTSGSNGDWLIHRRHDTARQAGWGDGEFKEDFRRNYEPIDPERKERQKLADYLNKYPLRAEGEPGYSLGQLALVDGVYYVKPDSQEKESTTPATDQEFEFIRLPTKVALAMEILRTPAIVRSDLQKQAAEIVSQFLGEPKAKEDERGEG